MDPAGSPTVFKPDFSHGQPVMVYKTKQDYYNNVPVLLSDDKSEITMYPHPSDLRSNDAFSLPTKLKNGYLLDNRGITKNVAFLKLTYEQYSRLESVPSLKELQQLIIDKDPLLELCYCGSKTAFTNTEIQLNQLIDTKKLRSSCKIVK
jgi:hypothetical protein